MLRRYRAHPCRLSSPVAVTIVMICRRLKLVLAQMTAVNVTIVDCEGEYEDMAFEASPAPADARTP